MARTYSKKLTRAEDYLVDLLNEKGQSIITHYEFFRLIQIIYREGRELNLNHAAPTEKDYRRFLRNLHRTGVIKYDEDYGSDLFAFLLYLSNQLKRLFVLPTRFAMYLIFPHASVGPDLIVLPMH